MVRVVRYLNDHIKRLHRAISIANGARLPILVFWSWQIERWLDLIPSKAMGSSSMANILGLIEAENPHVQKESEVSYYNQLEEIIWLNFTVNRHFLKSLVDLKFLKIRKSVVI